MHLNVEKITDTKTWRKSIDLMITTVPFFNVFNNFLNNFKDKNVELESSGIILNNFLKMFLKELQFLKVKECLPLE